ncbi:MAG: NADP-dependent glyceraldehyde-3-phosphate dehydrogenase [Eubacteriales bacterium]
MFSEISDGLIYKNLINGKWVASNSGRTIKIKSPSDNSLVGEVQAQTKEEVDETIDIANKAQKDWAGLSVSERASYLHKAAVIMEENVDELRDIIMKEIAKNHSQAESEVKRTVDYIKFTADTAKNLTGEAIYGDAFPGFDKNKISIVNRVPLGTVLCISPFNYPVNLSASKIAPALAGGNTVIFKPPTQGSISGLYMAKVFQEAGIPDGVLNVITGKGSEIGDYLTTHPGINMINFTGSTDIGKRISEQSNMVPLLLELGGKDAAIVLEDSDLDETAQNIVKGAFAYSGQRCTAVKRVIVMKDIADELVEKILNEVKELKVGKPEEDAGIIPLINKNAADYVEALINDAKKKGANLLIGDKREGNLLWPTVFDNVKTNMRLAWEEPFGPVLPIIRVDSIDEAIEITNESEYGLQASVFTKNIDKALSIAEKIEVGTVQINNKSERGPDHFPFIGVKNSGMGTQGIRYSIEAMTRNKVIVLNVDRDFK